MLSATDTLQCRFPRYLSELITSNGITVKINRRAY